MKGCLVILLTLFSQSTCLCFALDHSPPPDRSLLYDSHELLEWLREHKPDRKITQLHVHHTWDPSYADFTWGNHQELQDEMKSLHVEDRGWDNIGQHLTLFPDGMWILGRDLEVDPASIRGWNTGAVAIEMVGNFDIGADQMTPFQREAIVEVSRFFVKVWNLKPCFHRDNPDTNKTCPGTSIQRSVFMELLYSDEKPEDLSQLQR